jgi:hypothetical protein
VRAAHAPEDGTLAGLDSRAIEAEAVVKGRRRQREGERERGSEGERVSWPAGASRATTTSSSVLPSETSPAAASSWSKAVLRCLDPSASERSSSATYLLRRCAGSQRALTANFVRSQFLGACGHRYSSRRRSIKRTLFLGVGFGDGFRLSS